MWFRTVRSLTPSSSPISRFVRPRATWRRISSWRAVRARTCEERSPSDCLRARDPVRSSGSGTRVILRLWRRSLKRQAGNRQEAYGLARLATSGISTKRCIWAPLWRTLQADAIRGDPSAVGGDRPSLPPDRDTARQAANGSYDPVVASLLQCRSMTGREKGQGDAVPARSSRNGKQSRASSSRPHKAGETKGVIILSNPVATNARSASSRRRCSECGRFIAATASSPCAHCLTRLTPAANPGSLIAPHIRTISPVTPASRQVILERVRREFVMARPSELRSTPPEPEAVKAGNGRRSFWQQLWAWTGDRMRHVRRRVGASQQPMAQLRTEARRSDGRGSQAVRQAPQPPALAYGRRLVIMMIAAAAGIAAVVAILLGVGS